MRLYIRSCTISHGLIRSRTVSHGLSRSCTIANTIIHGHFTDTLEWPEYYSDKVTVGSVVCTVYTDGQPYKLCVLCQTGISAIFEIQ